MDPVGSKQLDSHRLAAWHEENAERLRAFVFGLLRDDASTDEVVQATFAKALTHGAEVKPGSERSWLFQVAFNEAMALRRKAGIHQRSLNKMTPRPVVQTAEQTLLRSEMSDRVREAVARLSEPQRQVVLRRIYDEQTFQEIADDLQIPLGTVLSRMRTALQRLQNWLTDPDDRPT